MNFDNCFFRISKIINDKYALYHVPFSIELTSDYVYECTGHVSNYL